MKRKLMSVAAILSILLYSGCTASVDEISQKQGITTSMRASTSTSESFSASSSASSQKNLTSATENKTVIQRKSTTVNASVSPVASFPKIEQDPQLISPFTIAKNGRFIYTKSHIDAKKNLLKIDTVNHTYTALTNFPVGYFLLVNESIYYTATNPATGHSALYVLGGTNPRMLTDKNIGLFWAYKNKLYFQTKDNTDKEEYTLYRMNLDGQGIVKHATGPSVITIFHDRIYYIQSGKVCSMTMDGTDIKPLFNFQGIIFTVRPDAIYYLEDYPQPRGTELYKRSITGTTTRLCSAPGYMYSYSTDYFLYFISFLTNTVQKMRLDGSSAQSVSGIPENLMGYNHFDNIFYAWHFDSDGNIYFSWVDLNTHKVLGKILMGRDETYQTSEAQTSTISPNPIQPWEIPYSTEKIVSDCKDYATKYKLIVVDDISPEAATGKWIVSTFQSKTDTKEDVFQKILAIAMAGSKYVSIVAAPDANHPGDYLIYILYDFKTDPVTRPSGSAVSAVSQCSKS